MIQNNGESLAYLGDSIYELEIRKHLILAGYTSVDRMHKMAITFTSGESQAKIVDYLLDNELLDDVELSVYKRGRNSHHSSNRRKISRVSYQKSTGFEALIGYLYLDNKIDRMNEIICVSLDILREE